ncbi:hypothetical protein A9Q83_01135 [Alphaproteobacteria bacterium 46_93_T64]|nr:hypothetical protein A9Q83_01135 [Alphaproteobacteria bacterium 46_93_T64]
MEDMLRNEVIGLVRYVERLRKEIANLAHGQETDETSFQNMSDQLGAIVTSTEKASNMIMEASEGIINLADKLDENLEADEHQKSTDGIRNNAVKVLEACSFQDIAGQRVTKILNSLQFVELRVEKMIDVCGSDAISQLVGEIPKSEQDENEVAMHGPALNEEGISQEEIDALFD